MQHFFKTALLFIFLGFFLFPKTSSAAPILKDSCCAVLKTECCESPADKKDGACHSNDAHTEGRDCQNCYSCSAPAFFAHIPEEHSTTGNKATLQSFQRISSYLTPEFADFTAKIWQPPKII